MKTPERDGFWSCPLSVSFDNSFGPGVAIKFDIGFLDGD